MYKYVLCIFLFLSTFAIAASKKDSLNQDKALIEKETMFNAGTWKLYMEKCDGKAQKRLISELQRLSWPDFRNYTRGAAKYASGWSSGSCDGGETQKGRNFYNWVIDELVHLTGDKPTKQTNIDIMANIIRNGGTLNDNDTIETAYGSGDGKRQFLLNMPKEHICLMKMEINFVLMLTVMTINFVFYSPMMVLVPLMQ